jgi:hypothetical protein
VVHGVYPLLATVSHNTNPNRNGSTWSQRIAFTQAVSKGDVPRLKRMTADRIESFAESIDDLFMAYETTIRTSKEKTKPLWQLESSILRTESQIRIISGNKTFLSVCLVSTYSRNFYLLSIRNRYVAQFALVRSLISQVVIHPIRS